MSILDHIILFGFLFALFFFITRIPQKSINQSFWQIMIFVIIIYSVITGCRYGWGNDYLWYKLRFENPDYYEDENIGFKLLNLAISGVGLNYVGAFITYSLVYITAAFVLIKDYKENKYMLALFLPATLLQNTFTIRQSVGHSLVFLAMHYLNKRKWGYVTLMIALAYTIHPAAILLIIPVIPFYLFVEKPIPLKFSIPIYIVVALSVDFFNTQITSTFSNYLPYLTLGNKFDNYLQNERWYSEDGIREHFNQSTLTLILSMAFHIGIIYLSYVALKYRPNKTVLCYYNTVVIGLILLRVFWNFEIFRRIVTPYTILYFIPLGYAFYFFKYCIHNVEKKEYLYCKIALYSVLGYLILFYGRFVLQSPDYIFFWNK